MTPRSPARRMMLICALVLVAALFAPAVARQVLSVWYEFVPRFCGPAFAAPDPSFVCAQLARRPSIPELIALLVVSALILLAGFRAVRWALRPVLELTPVIANVGPQNLGHRLNPGAGHDELAVLARTIDEMMDRIAVGYDAQRRFAADASHELRTPLAVQRTLIEVGLSRARSADQVELLTAQLLETNIRNERLIEGLLVLSESDRGLVSRTPQRLDLIVAAVLADHQARAAEAGVSVTSRLAPRVVPGERVLLERLVTNLVQNAVKYNRPGGTIDVEVGAEPALLITNTGDDVPSDAVTGLFEPFRRLAGTRIDHSGGSGLGLAIARSITRAHDGTITATSTGHDGLRVALTFP